MNYQFLTEIKLHGARQAAGGHIEGATGYTARLLIKKPRRDQYSAEFYEQIGEPICRENYSRGLFLIERDARDKVAYAVLNGALAQNSGQRWWGKREARETLIKLLRSGGTDYFYSFVPPADEISGAVVAAGECEADITAQRADLTR